MIDSLYIAWKYIRFYRLRSLILVTCVALIAILPLSLQLLLADYAHSPHSPAVMSEQITVIVK